MYINLHCPPTPHFIVAGESNFRPGDKHEKRTINNTFDIIFVREGTLFIEEKNKLYNVNKNQILILNPNTLHSGYKYCQKDTKFLWIHFFCEHYTFTNDIKAIQFSKMNKNKYYLVENYNIFIPKFSNIDDMDEDTLDTLFNKIIQVKINNYTREKSFNSLKTDNFEAQIIFLEILKIICKNQLTVNLDISEEIFKYINTRYSEKIDLEALSEHFNFHPTHIIRIMKDKYGKTPIEILTEVRLTRSKYLLKHTNMTIIDIATEIGYADSSYFCKVFKKYTYMTPTNYRLIKTCN